MSSNVLIEVDDLPVDVISRDAAIEMSFKPQPAYYARCRELGVRCRRFYDPKIRSIHPWLARRPRSVARFSILASLLPASVSSSKLLELIGFTKRNIMSVVERGYPPLISYMRPVEAIRGRIVVDPMAGGGSIALEALTLGARVIAIDYNPLAYLILKATVEFPARYGLELWKRVCIEAEKLIEYAKNMLSNFYGDVDGYIYVRNVVVNCRKVPLVNAFRLTNRLWAVVENGRVRVVEQKVKAVSRLRELRELWIAQHRRIMEGDRELYKQTLTPVVVQHGSSFKEAGDSEIDKLSKAYEKYLEHRSLIPAFKTSIPADNILFKEVLGLRFYGYLFNPRQALALAVISGYVRRRFEEL